MSNRGKAAGKRGRSPAGRRVLALALSLAVACGMAGPAGGAFAWGAESDSGSLEGLGDLGQAYLAESGSGGNAETEGLLSDEVSLFQSVDGADLRTYAAQADWYLGVNGMETAKRLYTEQQTTDYGGNVVIVPHENTPSALRPNYVIIDLALTKTVAGGASFAADQMVLTVNGTAYERLLSDGFLTNHNYTAFPNTEVLAGSKTGDVVFEVTDVDAAVIDAGWKAGMESGTISLTAGPVTGVPAEVNEDQMTAVPLGGYLVDQQFQAELDLLATYKSGTYTIENPLFVRDPYDITPLTGIAMFQTAQEASAVEVTIRGQDGDADTVYQVETSGTTHQIPIYMLYAGCQNTIALRALDAAGNQTAASGDISNGQTDTSGVSGYETVTVTAQSELPMEPGFTLLWTEHMTVIDATGKPRWYQSMGVGGESGANLLTDRGTIYFTDRCNGRVGNPSIVYEMNWSGKIIAQYLYKGDSDGYPDAHHDLAESADGSQILYGINNDIASNAIRVVDKNTGASIKKLRMSAIVTKTASGDWSHLNTITMLPDEPGVYLLSLRNQDLVMKYDLDNDNVIWAFSPKKEYHEANNPKLAGKMITLDTATADRNGQPAAYFYHQHEITMLPDQDGDSGTEDILLFDNQLTGPGQGSYSRVVHYRIDLASKTARQIYSAKQAYSSYYGGAELLTETGNYTATGASKVYTQYSPTGETVFSAVASGLIFRSFQVNCGDMTRGYIPLGTLRGKAFMRLGEETPFVKYQLTAKPAAEAVAAIEQIAVHGQQLMLKGSASYSSATAKKSVQLIADDGKNQYCWPLISASTADVFDNTVKTAVPLSLGGLPQGRYNLGIRVEESGTEAYWASRYYLEKGGSIQVSQSDDVGQREVVEELIAKAKDPDNTLTNPVVLVNPFGKAPLSGMAAFHTARACNVRVTVKGKPAGGDEVPADVTYEISGGKTTDHVIPLIGLYENYNNTVVLEAGGQTAVVRVKVGEINQDHIRAGAVTASAVQRNEALPGLTFMTPAGAQTVPFAIDVNGEVRWVYECAAAAPVETKPLHNGHFLVPSDRPSTEIFVTDAETVLEIDLAGRVYAEYFLDGMPHHEVFERKNGNLIFALSRRNSTSIEDYMVEVDRETGQALRTWDFRKILGIPEYDASYDTEQGGTDDPNAPHRAHPSIQSAAGNHPYSDWFHQNSLDYDEGDPADPSDDAIYVTARHQSCLIKINAEKAAGENPDREALEWIYTDPSWLPQSTLDLKALVLKPEGAADAQLLEDLQILEPQEQLEETATTESGIETGGDTVTDGGIGTENTQMPESGGAAENGTPDGGNAADGAEDTEGGTTDDAEGSGAVNAPAAPGQEGEPQETPEKSQQEGESTAVTGLLKAGMTGSLTTDTGNVGTAAQGTLTDAPDAASPAALTADLTAAAGGSECPYIYGPHAVEMLDNGDLILYDNHLYGSKTEMLAATGLFSRALRLRVNEENRTFRIQWEYGRELGSSHYTPFIGDVDYLGTFLAPGQEVTDEHYLINFGGITRNAAGDACDVVAAMLGGTISAETVEYKDGEIIWSARFEGGPGKVSSAYRAERVDLSQVPFSSEDYAAYSPLENRGMYANTPQAAIPAGVLDTAGRGAIPIVWSLLQDEGNRLIGKFTLPHVMTDTASENAKPRAVYAVLDMGTEGRRIYEVGTVAPLNMGGINVPGYYKFEIMKDDKATQIQLLIERNDGVWILGETGEVASANMQYVTGEVPVIDPAPPTVNVSTQADEDSLAGRFAASANTSWASVLLVAKGGLEPGKKYVYEDPATGMQTDLAYSPVHGGYVLIVPGKDLAAMDVDSRVKSTAGTVGRIRAGVVADDWMQSVNGVYRSLITPSDLFYMSARLADGGVPYLDPERVMAMDVTGDLVIDLSDFTSLINAYLYRGQ
ncbi:aryl-sulfate sulfotransferase [Bacilliculturomica massiliensis]|uniref:aryl-sulfate sulfotransferase n=1 Tax=Bacilliculturomica massiliensis TaxID=1917867 RepID=UPI00103266E2|nr:aryl-sulfate sulfotransferase [Bacilliculturomica massiliensis]